MFTVPPQKKTARFAGGFREFSLRYALSDRESPIHRRWSWPVVVKVKEAVAGDIVHDAKVIAQPPAW
jgi:hypothetical protein